MKFLKLILPILFVIACVSQKTNKEKVLKFTPSAEDSTEYELIVFDPGYETFLISHAKPMNFYGHSYYKTKNQFYVANWNSNARSSGFRPPYECIIDYEHNIDYGIELDYRLFNFFRFIEHSYNMKIMP